MVDFRQAVIVALYAALLAPVAPALAEVPTPTNARIVAPGGAVPSECARFSGAWAGDWTRGSGSFEVWVTNIAPDCRAQIVFAWDARFQGKAGFAPFRGAIANGTLSFEMRPRNRGDITGRIDLTFKGEQLMAKAISPRHAAMDSTGPLVKKR